MATIFSHPAVAIGLLPWLREVRNSRKLLLAGVVMTILPDLDVIGLRAGIPYEHMLGHRGLTHSLPFAAAFAALVTLVFHLASEIRLWAVWLYLFLSMASHGVTDALTNGGLGIAFLAPFNNERYFFAWRPLEVSTLNIRYFFEGQGASVLASELIWLWPACLTLLLTGYFAKRLMPTG